MILLAPDTVELLHAPTAEDGHGWVAAEVQGVAWTGPGNLQTVQPTADAQAADLGGQGPYQPRHYRSGTVYVAEECPVVPGNLLRVRDTVWVAQQVQQVVDPTGGFGLTALLVTVTEQAGVAEGG